MFPTDGAIKPQTDWPAAHFNGWNVGVQLLTFLPTYLPAVPTNLPAYAEPTPQAECAGDSRPTARMTLTSTMAQAATKSRRPDWSHGDEDNMALGEAGDLQATPNE